jgi:N-acetylmuramoyl-L-alanine amidase
LKSAFSLKEKSLKIRTAARPWNRREFFLAGVLGACGQMQPNRPPDPSQDPNCATDKENPDQSQLSLETRDGRCIRQAADDLSSKKRNEPTSREGNTGGTTANPSTPEEGNTTHSGRLNDLKVTFDVGHGFTESGWDTGAVAKTMIEYELNRISVKQATLELRSQGATVQVNDYSSSSLGKNLTQKGLAAGSCDLFVSVHHNAIDGLGSVQGTEVYFHTNGSFSDKRLAEELQQALLKNLWGNDQTKNRGIKSARFAILGSVPKSVGAACLTEAFFITHKDLDLSEAQVLSKKAGTGIAEAIGLYWTQKSVSLSLFGNAKSDWPITPFPEMASAAMRSEH